MVDTVLITPKRKVDTIGVALSLACYLDATDGTNPVPLEITLFKQGIQFFLDMYSPFASKFDRCRIALLR